MALFFLCLLVCVPLLSLLYLLSKIIKNRSCSYPPGPHGLPFIGNLHQIDYSSLHTFLWQLSKSYGPVISLQFGFIPAIVVSSANVAKEVLKTQDIIFCNRPSFVGSKKLSYNGLDVTFSPYNDYWRDMRKVYMFHLLSPKKVESFRYIREDEVSSTMKKIYEQALSSKMVNLSETMKHVAITLVTRVGFGKSYQDEHERKNVLRLLNELQSITAEFFVSDLWPGLPFVGLVDRFLGKMDRVEKCFKSLDSFYEELIGEHLDPQNRKSNEEEEDIVDILLRLKKDKDFNFTYDHIKGMLVDILVAGTDTSAATVIWAMTSLVSDPRVMKKTQEEVRNVVGKKGRVDEDDLSKLTYLKAVVKETLRLYPPAPLLVPRESQKDVILHGYKIKKKTIVYVNAFAIGRDPEAWENPEKFIPERFLCSDIDFRGNNFEFIPFGAGRRICPGMSMGVVTVELLIANLVYLFDWALPDGMKKEDLDFEAMEGITMHKRNDLCLVAHMYL
ncbi:6,7,8-trihydroxycoumarin synthase [Lactuca sativa]|uniref:Cytochrome P450 n=1 Tax=Lactuca sativa TaxID=4236 RepID=A0A9R1XEF7_LACSA|nr:6,7,8-trihydroxycoumarin synthase [Lactuca sativa]KAJ0211465.1 hypothetical protein LSAT_V11C400202180 [Lactuca sativa]